MKRTLSAKRSLVRESDKTLPTMESINLGCCDVHTTSRAMLQRQHYLFDPH